MAAGPEIAVYPPAVSVAAPLIAVALEWLLPLGLLPPPGAPAGLIPGLALLVLAGGLALSGSRAFAAQGTNVDPRQPALELVRKGPYRFTRNPMYLGMIVLQPGLALSFSLDWAIAGAICVWGLLHFGVVLPEERYLSARFGDTYRDYMGKTRRWL